MKDYAADIQKIPKFETIPPSFKMLYETWILQIWMKIILHEYNFKADYIV